MAKHTQLRDNGKKITMKVKWEETMVASNLAYITSVMDFWTIQKKKYKSDDLEDVRTCKIEFQFPKIDREYGNGDKWFHIKWVAMKISNYKSSSPEMSNSKMVDIILATGSDSLPASNEKCLSFIKNHCFNKPLLILSITREWNDGNTYDEIVEYKELDKEVVKSLETFEPFLWNKYFDFENFDESDFDELAPFHKDEIKKSSEWLNKQSKPDYTKNDLDLPFNQ